MENNRYGWVKSKGSCGYNVDGPVYAKYIRPMGLFAWERDGFWTCAVTGVMSCGGQSLEECQIAGENAAYDSRSIDRDRNMSKEEFDAIVKDSTILGLCKTGEIDGSEEF